MRIIAGRLGGRLFESPHTHRTHPRSDKMRGALFNILGELTTLRVLDAFAGTGALAFEAISRGAAHAVAIEPDRAAQLTITDNIASLGLQNEVSLVRASAGAWLQTNLDHTFDIVLCDPPYNDLQRNLLERLSHAVAAGGLLVLSFPADQPLPDFAGLAQIHQATHGDAQLAVYRKLP